MVCLITSGHYCEMITSGHLSDATENSYKRLNIKKEGPSFNQGLFKAITKGWYKTN